MENKCENCKHFRIMKYQEFGIKIRYRYTGVCTALMNEKIPESDKDEDKWTLLNVRKSDKCEMFAQK